MKRQKIQLQAIESLLRRADALALPKDARVRLRWFEFYATHEYNASLTCRHFGIARSTFARWLKRFDSSDERTLEEESRRPKHVRLPETDDVVIAMVGEMRRKNPLMNKGVIREELLCAGHDVSLATVGRIITRNRFFFADTPSHRRKRGNHLVEFSALNRS